jgi:ABC-type transport system involved in cytochrome c biogenesis ATPase subunit
MHTIVRDLSFSIKPGEVALISGPSGSGKSTMLRLFAGSKECVLSGSVKWPSKSSAGTFAAIHSEKAMIELLGRNDVRTALHLMGLVGLSDATTGIKDCHCVTDAKLTWT